MLNSYQLECKQTHQACMHVTTRTRTLLSRLHENQVNSDQTGSREETLNGSADVYPRLEIMLLKDLTV